MALERNNDVNSQDDCQLIALYDASSELSWLDRGRLILVRIYLSLIRRAKKAALGLRREFSAESSFQQVLTAPPNLISPPSPLRPGDIVQILPYEEIAKTLGKDQQTQGLHFMAPMKKYCGTTAKVLKNVHMMFDERSWGMIRIKNVVLLEGVICDGQNMVRKQGCTRSCYWFWKDAWLKKWGP